ncbi:hypothetical protein M5K25_009324 [Dendrobium thyrsiflorum]|uniref:Uncharacterized protein n=1 Tax=Dendrobium thyrsiflorum TaxID=117978 RepID=A0ABD0V593_DENTH
MPVDLCCARMWVIIPPSTKMLQFSVKWMPRYLMKMDFVGDLELMGIGRNLSLMFYHESSSPSNQAILEPISGERRVHIVNFDIAELRKAYSGRR